MNWEPVIRGIIIFLVFCILCDLISIIGKLKDYIVSKTKIQKEPMTSRINSTTAVLSLVNELIETEISELFIGLESIKQEYKILNLDGDVEDISKTVYKALRPNTLTDEELTVTPEYIMEYINHQVKIRIIMNIKKHNAAMQVFTGNN